MKSPSKVSSSHKDEVPFSRKHMSTVAYDGYLFSLRGRAFRQCSVVPLLLAGVDTTVVTIPTQTERARCWYHFFDPPSLFDEIGGDGDDTAARRNSMSVPG